MRLLFFASPPKSCAVLSLLFRTRKKTVHIVRKDIMKTRGNASFPDADKISMDRY